MQFKLTTRSKLYSLSGVAWHGMAWCGVALHCMVLALGFISILGGCLQHLYHGRVVSPCGAFPGSLRAVLVVSGSFTYQACACACPRGCAWLSVWCGGACVLSSISSPSSPYSGE